MSNRALTLWLIDDDDPTALLRGPLHNDVARARALADRIYGDAVTLVPVAATNLAAAMSAGDSHAYVGSFGSASVISSPLFASREPSTLTKTVTSLAPAKVATLLHTEPVESVGVFARWEDGELRRSFSANPIDIYEDSGLPFVFESPFWGGEFPLQYAEGVAPQPLALPFHPAQLAEHANREWLGFRFTPPAADGDVDPSRIPVTAFAIHPADYQPTPDDERAYAASRAAAYPVAPTPGGQKPSAPADAHEGGGSPEAPADAPKGGRVRRYFGFGSKD
ncbi:hypothetical protein GOEFS_037_00230 [Gordonia effusa NBRC 100432]|uniref:Uncharacterized protein n=1 Tax=Gordonia effusa NBRC 100432 TaxID=1077974 RepID=H0QY19_9ACTN|nr:hypothetical protein [Gordonia effusa]GAB17720.1 hypothetical protein GOEFS_037_00230 [Gordonia effusa NBRC 100432]